MSKPTNRYEFATTIKNRLGDEFVPVQLSDFQMDDIINRSIDFFHEQVPDFSRDNVLSLPFVAGQRDYVLAANIYTVTELVPRGSWFNLFYNFGQKEATVSTIDYFIQLGRNPSHNLFDAEILMQNLSMFNSILVPKNEYFYNFNTHTLTFFNAAINTDFVYCVVNELLDFDQTGGGNTWGNRLLLEYAEAIAKIQYAANLKKFDGMQLPGGAAINWRDFESDGKEAKKEIEEFIYNNYFDASSIYKINMA